MKPPSFDPAFPVPVIVTVAGMAAAFTIYRALRGRPMKPRWMQVPAVLLRLVVIALLALLLLNPSRRITQEAAESSSLILLDRSASMKLATGDKSTRLTDGLGWVEEARREIGKSGHAVPAVAVFGDGLESVNSSEALAAITPAGNETRLASALSGVLERDGDAAPRQIIVVSDGCAHDRGELPKALSAARDLGAKISTKLVGTDTAPRNAWIAAVQAPRSVRPKAKVSVHVDLASSGITKDEPMAVILKDETGKEVARTDYRAAGDSILPTEKVLNFEIGLRTTKYTLELVPALEEVATDDNRFSFTVEVSSSKLRVLFVEGTHVKRSVGTTGHWFNDMELMTRAWDATGEIEYECLTPISEYNDSPNLVGVTFQNGEMRQDPSKSFPSTREDLYRFDVMLISDVPVGNFSNDQMQWVVDWVNERGGGFLMGGGYTTFDVGNYDQTPWEKIIPVDMLAYGAGFMEKTFPIRIPDAVRGHPLWRVSDSPEENQMILDKHPVFLGMNRVKRAKPGAIVLAVRADEDGDEPVIAAQSYGRGRSIAWLPDPNGGWARQYVSWGPPGGPRQGPHTELGHGANFRFKTEAANAATGPTPPHPSPWYGEYWVNLVKWLGEHSIRWHRDKLAGRAKAAAAKPGELLPVAAEVLAVTKLDELLTLDVGARLDIPGTPRVRLEYDRDAREFVGQLPIPANAEGEQVTVFFDVSTDGSAFTDTVPVGLRRSHLEFTETAPDQAFMEELATAAAGKTLESPQNAAAWLGEVEEARSKQAAVAWNQPLWPRWPLLVTIIALLCLEWLLRRRSMIPVTAALAFLLMPDHSQAAEVETETKDIAALVEQLGAPKVRLRDEAEDQLRKLPNALAALKEAAEASPSVEARLRAANLLTVIKQQRWKEDAVLSGHVGGTNRRLWAMVVDERSGSIFTRSQDGVRQWNLSDLGMNSLLGTSLSLSTYWTSDCPLLSLAVSPDGKTLISTDSNGNLVLNDIATGALRTHEVKGAATTTNVRMPDGSTTQMNIFTEAPRVYVGFTPENDLMVSGIDSTLKILDLPSLEEKSNLILPHIGQEFTFTKDKSHMVVAYDAATEPDFIEVRDWPSNEVTCAISIPNRPNTVRFNPDETKLVASNREGTVHVWDYKDGVLSNQKTLMRAGANTNWAIFSEDGKSIFVSSGDVTCCLSEWDAETGEMIWTHPPSQFGVRTIAFLPDGRLIGTCSDVKMRVWKRGDR